MTTTAVSTSERRRGRPVSAGEGNRAHETRSGGRSCLIVAKKPGNPCHGDPVERRGAAERNTTEASMGNTPVQSDGSAVSTKQARIAELMRLNKGLGLDNLHPFMDISWLMEAFERTRKDGAPGVDGV